MANNSRTFAYLSALSHTKDRRVLDEPQFAKEYVPFIINRALSYHQDAVLAANAMNERPWLDTALQFQFLLNTLAARKRFSKWIKATVPNDVRAVAEYYGCSMRHARELVGLHTMEQMKIIRSRLDKGGTATKAGSRHDDS
jgi:hypothetical protein